MPYTKDIKLATARKGIDPKLDRMIGRNIKCPYCKNRIFKYTTTCDQCGITKEQICYASNQQAKEIIRGKRQGKVLYTKSRPDDVPLGKFMLILILLGLFGGHNFFVGRRVRGWIILSMMAVCFAFLIAVPPGTAAYGFENYHEWRGPFYEAGFPFFPTDVLGLIAFMVWVCDWIAVLIGNFKYPIRIETGRKVTSEDIAKLNNPKKSGFKDLTKYDKKKK